MWDQRINASNIQVESKNGKIILKGTVPSYLMRNQATESSYLVNGVESVDNELQIKYPAVIKKTPESALIKNAQIALELNVSIDASKIDVKASGGNLTLEGTVDALWKKDIAENVVSELSGVKSILNKITIVPTEDKVDTEIADDIVNAVDRHYELDPDDINIKVKEGKITLSGNVPSWDSREELINVVKNTSGVIDFKDNLKIQD